MNVPVFQHVVVLHLIMYRLSIYLVFGRSQPLRWPTYDPDCPQSFASPGSTWD